MEFIKEIMSDDFTKYHIIGLPFDAVLHHFTDVHVGEPHDHPYSFTTFILSGGYIERVYSISPEGFWSSEDIYNNPGSIHTVEANHIHEIIALPEGECWTLILPKEKVKDSGFYKFDHTGVQFRLWYDKNFSKIF